MGYTTKFSGQFHFDRPLDAGQVALLKAFAEEEHGSPSNYCQWVPTDDGTGLRWDHGEKFYHYIKWLNDLIKRFFMPWGRKLSGTVTYSGEDTTDNGRIVVTSNVVQKIPNPKVGGPASRWAAFNQKELVLLEELLSEAGGKKCSALADQIREFRKVRS